MDWVQWGLAGAVVAGASAAAFEFTRRHYQKRVQALEAKMSQARAAAAAHEPWLALRKSLPVAVGLVAADNTLTPLTAAFLKFVPLASKRAELQWAELFSPAHVESAHDVLSQLRANTTEGGAEVEFYYGARLAGENAWCRATLRKLAASDPSASILVMLSNETNSQQAEVSRQVAARALELVRDPVAVLAQDADQVEWVNTAFEHWSGWSTTAAKGLSLTGLLKSQPVGAPMPGMVEIVAQGNEWEGEFRSIHAEGHTLTERRRVRLVEDDANTSPKFVVVFTDLAKDLEVQEHLRVLSNLDVATELPNLYGFLSALRVRLHQIRGTGRLSVVHMDFHACESLRASQGPLAVDAVLRRIAQQVSAGIAEDSLLSRVGPAQLAFVLSTVNQPLIEANLHALSQLLSQASSAERTDVYTSVSIGVAPGGEGVTPENLLHAAHLAGARLDPILGVNLGYFNDKLQAEMSRRLAVERALRDALKDAPDEISLHFQPKVNPYRASLVGFEALCRWTSKTLGPVSPTEFIAAAEDIGLIQVLGDLTFELTCKTLAAWRKDGLPLYPVAVNVSAQQLARETLAADFLGIATRYGISPSLVELEITETAVIADIHDASRLLLKLRAAGFALALDDFGTGQSSLAYLRTLPLDGLKIDRSFISDIESRPAAAAICRSILELGKTLGLKITAEGVETPGQLQFLVDHRCDVIQGYLFSKPVAAKEVARILEEQPEMVVTSPGPL